MSSRYQPPHMRSKKVAPEPQPAPEQAPKSMEDEFPQLTATSSTMKVFGGTAGKSFANMATDWAKHTEEQKKEEEILKKEQESLQFNHRQRKPNILPQFHNVRHFVEPEDDESDEEEEKNVAPVDPEELGWTEVKPKKRRKVKTFEERMARPSTPEEKTDETVWNGNEEDDSYWNR